MSIQRRVPRRIPLRDFFRKPERAAVRLSPDGAFLGWLAPHERRLNLHVRDLASGAERRVTDAVERDIAGWVWAGPRRLVFLRDSGGDENHRLHGVDVDGGNPLDLTPFPGVKCDVIDDLEDEPGQLLIQMNRRDARLFDAFRLDADSGEIRLVAENPGTIRAWFPDHAGRLRLALASDGVSTSLLSRATEDDEWREIDRRDFREEVRPLLWDFDDRQVFVASNVGRDRAAVFRYDPETGEHGELVFEHPDVDVAGLLHSKVRKAITGVVFQTDRLGYHFFDAERQAIQEFLADELPGRENRLVSSTRDETRFVVHSGGDRTRGRYLLLDRGVESRLEPNTESRLEPLFESAPWLHEEDLAEMAPIELESRDGLTLHGYLTLPPGGGDGPFPLVVNPHGGPWHRDSWGFNPEVQFLANRGAAVLQVNFRGSTGYGRSFWEASFGQWGLAMQDDVTDAVRWAIEQGIADPERIAIYGGSYGGFAALSGVTKTPELYACGISLVGVSSIFTWIAAFPPYWEPYLEMVHEMVGHPERDEERLRATSPLFHVERIRCPLLVAQGANDPRVRKEESDQVVAALRDREIEVEYLVKDDEGHGFQNEENQFDFYETMERFLQRHLRLESDA